MPAKPVITFIGAGSTVFTKNIAGDILQRPALAHAETRLMDFKPQQLEESDVVVCKLAATLVDDLIQFHGNCMPEWSRNPSIRQAAE